MRSYPIWCVVDAPNYNSSKSYGTREYTTTDIKIGTSASNSFNFVKTETKKTVFRCETTETEYVKYEFLVDDVVIKTALYNPKNRKVEILQLTSVGSRQQYRL